MSAQVRLRTAARALVDQLKIHGVGHVFTVPGESFLGVLDALHDSDIETDGLPTGGRRGDDG